MNKEIQPQPDSDFCSRCHEHTDFEQDEDGDLLSVCCSAQPVAMD